jgi:hypothetical protein
MEKSQVMGKKIREIANRHRDLSRTLVPRRGLAKPPLILFKRKRAMRLWRKTRGSILQMTIDCFDCYNFSQANSTKFEIALLA